MNLLEAKAAERGGSSKIAVKLLASIVDAKSLRRLDQNLEDDANKRDRIETKHFRLFHTAENCHRLGDSI